jgi:hypothetical protein
VARARVRACGALAQRILPVEDGVRMREVRK